MASNRYRIAAWLLWVLPAFLFLLVPHQAKVAYDLRQTLQNGEPAMAEVTEVHQENRVDVTYDWVSLRVDLPGGGTLTKNKVSLPHTLITQIEGKKSVPVMVRAGSDQEVVITEVASTQWRIAAMNAAMALVAALLFAVGVGWWNRYLRREGDPAETPMEREGEHPSSKSMRRA